MTTTTFKAYSAPSTLTIPSLTAWIYGFVVAFAASPLALRVVELANVHGTKAFFVFASIVVSALFLGVVVTNKSAEN